LILIKQLRPTNHNLCVLKTTALFNPLPFPYNRTTIYSDQINHTLILYFGIYIIEVTNILKFIYICEVQNLNLDKDVQINNIKIS
jgi:hypothetical protein